MQIVYLSNRPEVLAGTWAHTRHFMPWVDRAVVSVPEAARPAFDHLTTLGVDVVTDETVTGLSASTLAACNHVERNVTIRRALVERSGLVDDAFLLADDDYRPIKPVGRSFFGDDRRDVGYFSYDLAAWPGDETDFDAAQHITHQALAYWAFPHLSYGAHMPQLMRRDLWAEAFERFDRLTDRPMVCEWTLYFNVGQAVHPERFAEPQPFQTMCWPQYVHEWPWWVRPDAYAFENFYPDLYRDGHLFEGLATTLEEATAERTNFEKLLRWSRQGRKTAALDFTDDVANPWTDQSIMRRASFTVLRRMRKAYDYLSLEDRTAIVELTGAVARLEEELKRRSDSGR